MHIFKNIIVNILLFICLCVMYAFIGSKNVYDSRICIPIHQQIYAYNNASHEFHFFNSQTGNEID